MAHETLRFFKFEHLAPQLAAVSKPFAELATHIATTLPENDESREAMRKLLEAKDCAVRASL